MARRDSFFKADSNTLSGVAGAVAPVLAAFVAAVGIAGSHGALAAPLVWPVDCTHYWDIGDLSESYFIGSAPGAGESVIGCFNTLLAGPHAVQGGAADDLHLTIRSDRPGSFRIGDPGHQVEINDVNQTLGTGNLAGESFHFDAGVTQVDIVRHDGMALNLPIRNMNGHATLCVRFSDAGVVAPGPDPCMPGLGEPPFNPPVEDQPPPNGPRFPMFEPQFIGMWFDVPRTLTEPGSATLLTMAIAMAMGTTVMRWRRRSRPH